MAFIYFCAAIQTASVTASIQFHPRAPSPMKTYPQIKIDDENAEK
jgi:hypothetical protein